MFRRPYQFQCYRILWAFYNANAASQAMLINYGRPGLIGTGDRLHLYGIELAALDTGLTAAAKLLIHDSPVAAGSKDFMDIAVFE